MIWMKIGEQRQLVNMHILRKKPRSRSSRLFAVYNRTTHRSNCQVDLQNRPRSNLNPAIESPHATLYVLAIAMLCPICHHLREIRICYQSTCTTSCRRKNNGVLKLLFCTEKPSNFSLNFGAFELLSCRVKYLAYNSLSALNTGNLIWHSLPDNDINSIEKKTVCRSLKLLSQDISGNLLVCLEPDTLDGLQVLCFISVARNTIPIYARPRLRRSTTWSC